VSHAVLAALVAAAAYLPSLAGAFQFDDFNVIVEDPAVHSWGAFAAQAGSGIRPLLKASYTLSWTLGLDAFGFHLFNIAVHAANAALVFLAGRALCERWLGAEARRFDAAALAAALLFALHPAQTEAVTYISGRSTSLMALFYLAAVLAYLRGSRWSIALFLCALMTKETAITLPAALVLIEGFRRRQLAHWVLAGAALLALLLHERYFQLLTFVERDLAVSLLTQVGGVSYLVLRLVGLQGSNIDPALPVLGDWSASLALQAALLSILAALAILSYARRPWIGFGVLWFFLQLAPTNSVVPRLDVANDRQLYLASWGLFLALCVQVAAAAPPRRVAAAAAGLVLALFAWANLPRQLDYASEISLWEADAAKAPWNARARNNLGYAYQQAGRLDEARREYRAALTLDPGHVRARYNLAMIGGAR
jgi:tetratricopeptide (TPR) repeat protein